MIEPLTSPVANAVALTLIHFLWQGAAVGSGYCLLRESLRRQSIHSGYAGSLLTLGIMSVCPVVTFAWVYDAVPAGTRPQWTDSTQALPESNSVGGHQNPESSSEGQRVSLSHELPERTGLPSPQRQWSEVVESSDTASRADELTIGRIIQLSGPFVLLMWMAGVVLSGARLTAGLFSVLWLKAKRRPVSQSVADQAWQLAHRLGLTTASVFASDRIREAAVVGFWQPVVLLPASWVTSLPPDVIEAVIAHELAHIRRFDVWVNLLQRLVETLLFYHPAVWWISNCIRLEREMCCDELAVAATGQRGRYAIALEQVGRLKISGNQQLLAPSFSGEMKMNLLRRIQNVLGVSSGPTREPAWALGIAMVVLPLVLAGTNGFLSNQNLAVAQEREERRSDETESRRSPEAQSPRRSPEAEAGPRRSPEADTEVRRSAESESGRRRSEERERETRRSPERERDVERDPGERRERRERRESDEDVDRFRPQTDREEVLFRMIQELRREIAELRRSAGEGNRERDGESGRDSERDIPLGRRGGDRAETSLRAGWERSREGRVFKAYDKNGDGAVTVEEWLAMTNGNVSPARREVQTRRFNEAEPSGDGRFSAAEFIHWYSGKRLGVRDGGGREARDGDALRGRQRDGDRERPGRGPRDGEGAPERAPRHGEFEGRRGPRDGDRESDERRDRDQTRDDRSKKEDNGEPLETVFGKQGE